jgi:hypothetical protein
VDRSEGWTKAGSMNTMTLAKGAIRQGASHAILLSATVGDQCILLPGQREQRQRSSNKQKRPWPGRLPPKPIAPPRIRVLSDASKALLHQLLRDAA